MLGSIMSAAFDNFRLPMRGGKRYTKGVLACEIWTEPIPHFLNRQSGQSDSPIIYS